MKYIQKGDEPKALIDWKAQANDNWQPSYSDLRGNIKNTVTNTLMKEQGYLCCYCERRLVNYDCHIEHFKPQSHLSVDPLDYTNMLCSCQNQLKKGEPRHCGNRKGDWFDEKLLISPLNSECNNRFSFTGDGKIRATLSTDTPAYETINRLGLNIPKLNALRAHAIEPFLDDTLTEDDICQFVDGYLQKNANGYYGEFWTTIRYLFGEYTSSNYN